MPARAPAKKRAAAKRAARPARKAAKRAAAKRTARPAAKAAGAAKQAGGRLLRYVDALKEAVIQEMERDPDVFVFGLDVDDPKGIQGSTLGLQQRFGRERVFNTPLSE